MNRGFSLVELSIVLVILGLLTGGILAGQSLIRAAELRAVSTEFSRYMAATNTFRDKYFAIPGDMLKATSFWGDDNAACPDPAITNGTPGTCNGNGNGQIGIAIANGGTGEQFQFWKHMQLAGLIEGTYSGLAGTSDPQQVMPGENIPRSRLGNALWHIRYSAPNYAGDTAAYALDMGNHLSFGGHITSTPDATPLAGVLKPEEAWNIDTKMDDGRPAYGKIIAYRWNNSCAAPDSGAASNTNFNASYNLSNNTMICTLFLRNLF